MIKLVEYIDYDKFFKYYTVFNKNENIVIESATKREYLYKDVAAHILGYMEKTSKKDIQNDSDTKYYEQTGRTGLEKYYDKTLRGTLGYQEVQVNSMYKKIKVLKEIKPIKQDINLTIDIELQKYIHNLFKRKGWSSYSYGYPHWRTLSRRKFSRI